MAEKTDKCARPNCHCPAPAGQDYCSDQCQKAADDPDVSCLCGHPECVVAVAVG